MSTGGRNSLPLTWLKEESKKLMIAIKKIDAKITSPSRVSSPRPLIVVQSDNDEEISCRMRNIKAIFLLTLCGFFLCGVSVQPASAGCVDRFTDLANTTGCDSSQCDASCGPSFDNDGDSPGVNLGSLMGTFPIRIFLESLRQKFISATIWNFENSSSTFKIQPMQSAQPELLSSEPVGQKSLRMRG